MGICHVHILSIIISAKNSLFKEFFVPSMFTSQTKQQDSGQQDFGQQNSGSIGICHVHILSRSISAKNSLFQEIFCTF